ncbi:hypothetical protein, partial [Aeromicrobium sp. JJY06]|uniref:hypothetical protein n=1 Tax=Aeromicrobium sp. JJY06 TaxID=3373478 RepID=UPI00376ECB78
MENGDVMWMSPCGCAGDGVVVGVRLILENSTVCQKSTNFFISTPATLKDSGFGWFRAGLQGQFRQLMTVQQSDLVSVELS